MMDVEYVVRAIRDTTYEFEDLQQLLPLVKACGSYEEAQGMIKDLEEKSRQNVSRFGKRIVRCSSLQILS